MSFREKSAWISLVLIAVVCGYYFYRLFGALDTAGPRNFGNLFLGAVGVLVLAEIVFHVLAAIAAPREARTPADEREQAIALRSTQVAFFVLIVGAMLAAIAVVHAPASRWVLGNGVILAVVVAELVKFGYQVVLYRLEA